jgi:hypothetical protein
MERLARDKHSSLLCRSIKDKEKKFLNIDVWTSSHGCQERITNVSGDGIITKISKMRLRIIAPTLRIMKFSMKAFSIMTSTVITFSITTLR